MLIIMTIIVKVLSNNIVNSDKIKDSINGTNVTIRCKKPNNNNSNNNNNKNNEINSSNKKALLIKIM